jgi:hypothetical protein
VATTDQHPTHEHSTAVQPRAGHEQAVRYGVDPNEEPSAEWGWHGHFPWAKRIAGWLTAGALFAMLIGNHENYVENVWLITLGTLLVIMLVRDHLSSLGSRRR